MLGNHVLTRVSNFIHNEYSHFLAYLIKLKKRQQQDSNLCGETPADFESASLTTRTY